MLAPETVDLEISSHTVAGDYPDAPDGVVVWANNVTTTPVGWDEPFQQSRELTPFDENTGAAAGLPTWASRRSRTERATSSRSR